MIEIPTVVTFLVYRRNGYFFTPGYKNTFMVELYMEMNCEVPMHQIAEIIDNTEKTYREKLDTLFLYARVKMPLVVYSLIVDGEAH